MIMKKVIILFSLMLAGLFVFAQVPQSFSYQAVVRDGSGNVVIDQPVSFQMSIYSDSITGTLVYSETHAVTTNSFGLVTFPVGSGNVVTGNFATIDWGSAAHFLKAEVDIAGGTSYVDMGTVQLLAVPYALFAKSAANGFSGDYNDLSNVPDFTGWDQNESNDFSGSYNDLTNTPSLAGDVTGPIDSNTVTKIQGMDVSTNIPANGQVLKWNNITSKWEPSDDQAGTADGVVTDASFIGTSTKTLTLIRSNGLSDITATFTDLVNDADADPSNEIQTLTINGNNLTISDGNAVTLPQNIYTAGSGISMTGNTINNAAPDQTVTISNGTGITVAGSYPDFTLTNSSPDQPVTITGNGATTVTGTYPDFTVSSTDNNTTYTAGTGLTLTGTSFSHNAHTGDVTGTTALTVTGIQGNQVTSSAPGNNQILKWSTIGNRWELGEDQLGAAGTNDGVVTSINVTGTTTKTITLTRSQSLSDLTATFTDEGSVYTAGVGIDITGNTVSNIAPDQTVAITGSGATTVTGTYPNFTVTSTDNNTTYTAGTGLALAGTQFSSTQTLAQTLANGNSAGTYSINMNSQNLTAANILGLRTNNAAYIDMRYGHIYDNASSHGIDGQVLRVRGTSPNTYVKWEDATSLITAGTGLSYSVGTLNSVWSVNGTHIYNNNVGNVGVGLNLPNARLTVKGNSSAPGTEPLFEVKNRIGQTVFIVYEDSVRVYVDDDPAKTNKGAFAVSGRNTVKALTNDFFVVTPDSTRIWTGDSVKGFGVRNIGVSAKTSYMQMTPDNYFIGHEAGKAIVTNPGNTGKYNSFVGYQSGFNNTSGVKNYFIGYRAGYSNTTGYSNVFVGDSTGFTNSGGYYNVFIGNKSGNSNTSGYSNVFEGTRSGYNNTTGYRNIFIGDNAGFTNTTGNYNVFLGYYSGYLTNANYNVFLGYNCGYNNSSGSSNAFMGYQSGLGNTTGSSNVFVGNSAGYSNIDGSYNVFLGRNAGYNNASGAYNVFLGYYSGYSNTASYNSFIGYYAGRYNTTGTNNVFMGYQAGRYNSDGSSNVFVGNRAGYINTTGNNNVYLGYYAGYSSNADYNVFLGYEAGTNNTSGTNNVYIGYQAGRNNTTGAKSIYIGTGSGYTNTTGSWNVFLGDSTGCTNNGNYNSFIGYKTGKNNAGGGMNTAAGYLSFFFNTSGNFNVAYGCSTLFSNSTGRHNAANGYAALSSNTTGNYNAAFGAYALSYNTTGTYNTSVGYASFSYGIGTGYTNSTGLGYAAEVTASNQVRVGNTAVTSIGGYVGWTNLSDKRFKKDVTENVPGLDFILKLKPVTYHLDMDRIAEYLHTPDSLRLPDSERIKGEMLQSGFIAQDVENAANELGFDFSGVDKPKNENDFYGLRYAEFTVPLVKAVQEQQKIIEEQNARIKALENEIISIKNSLKE